MINILLYLQLQQHLPFTVLKQPLIGGSFYNEVIHVATALTVYGIETDRQHLSLRGRLLVATALTVYGIETIR